MSNGQYTKKSIQVREVKNKRYVVQLLWRNAWGFQQGGYSLPSQTQCFTEGLCADTQDSRYLLFILSLELHLKLLYLLDRDMLIYGHDQGIIFKMIDKETQSQIIESINSKQPYCADTEYQVTPDQLSKALTEFGNNFTKIRYLFDTYATLSEEQARNRIEDFLEAESINQDNADIIYNWDLLKDTLDTASDIALKKSITYFDAPVDEFKQE